MQKPALLTIDDGPSPDRPLMLEALEQHGVQAVFFSEGSYLEQRPELALATLRAGHHLGNHSWSHPKFSEIGVKQAHEEIERTHALIATLYKEAGVAQPGHWFRFPFGDTGDGRHGYVFSWWRRKQTKRWQEIQAKLIDLGYKHLQVPGVLPNWYAPLRFAVDTHWTFDPMEWSLNQDIPVFGIHDLEAVLRRIEQTHPPDIRGLLPWKKRWLSLQHTTEIIVMHDQAGLGKYTGEILGALSKHVSWLPVQDYSLPESPTK